MAQNPLELIYDTFWTLLENNSAFTDLVPVGNRIKYYDDLAQPDKPEVGSADVPEVRVVPFGLQAMPYSDSHLSSLRVVFAVQVATGRQEMTWLLKLQWAIFCSLLNWDTVLETLTWDSLTFVSSCRILESKDSMKNEELNRGIKGWSSVWQGEIECHFFTDTLRNFEGT